MYIVIECVLNEELQVHLLTWNLQTWVSNGKESNNIGHIKVICVAWLKIWIWIKHFNDPYHCTYYFNIYIYIYIYIYSSEYTCSIFSSCYLSTTQLTWTTRRSPWRFWDCRWKYLAPINHELVPSWLKGRLCFKIDCYISIIKLSLIKMYKWKVFISFYYRNNNSSNGIVASFTIVL